jgi:hypothetical protein
MVDVDEGGYAARQAGSRYQSPGGLEDERNFRAVSEFNYTGASE